MNKTAWWGVVALLFIASLYVRMAGFHYPYLRNIDSFLFYRYINWTVQSGLPSHDSLMLAPYGKDLPRDGMFYVLLSAYAYKSVSWLLDFNTFMVWWPAILASLMAIPAFLIGRDLFDERAGVLAALLILFSPQIMSRTLGGDPDTDSIVLLFSLVSSYLILKSIEEKGWKWPVVAGIGMALFAWTWPGYWYIYWLYLGYVAVDSLISLAKGKKMEHIVPFVAFTGVFIASHVLFTGSFHSLYVFKYPFESIGLFGRGGIKAEEGQFPNVYVSVAEMMSNNLSSLLRQVGSYLLIPGFLGVVYLLYSGWRNEKRRMALVFMSLWFAGFFYASLVAVRFSIFLILPSSFLTAIALSKFWRMLMGEGPDE